MKKLKKFWVRQNSYKDWPMIITSLIGLPESPYNYRPGVMPLPRTIFISKKIRERLIFYMNSYNSYSFTRGPYGAHWWV